MNYKNNGDLNGDNKVDIKDLQILIINWNKNYYSEFYQEEIFIDIKILQQLIINWNDVFESETKILDIYQENGSLFVDVDNPKNIGDKLILFPEGFDPLQDNLINSITVIDSVESGVNTFVLNINDLPNALYKLHYIDINNDIINDDEFVIEITNSIPLNFDLEEFNINKNLWQQKNIINYTFDFQWFCFCLEPFINPVSIKVLNNEIYSVYDKINETFIQSESINNFKNMDQLFEFITEKYNRF